MPFFPRLLTIYSADKWLLTIVAVMCCSSLLTVNARAAAPLVFLGDSALPPYEFLDQGVPRGANVDLA